LPASIDDWQLKRCLNCGFVYLENAHGYEQLTDAFVWTKTKAAEFERRREREPILFTAERSFRHLRRRIFGRRCKATGLLREFVGRGTFLDIGCGAGGYIRRAAPELVGSGIEVEPGAAQEADEFARTIGGRVIQADALSGLQQFEDNSFDGCLMRGYLEHEIEPRQVLDEVHRVLKPGGHIVVQVPNYGSINRRVRGNRWCGYRFPDHVNYFTPHSLRQMVTDHGFEVVRFHLLNRHPFSDRMWMAAKSVARAEQRAAA